MVSRLASLRTTQLRGLCDLPLTTTPRVDVANGGDTHTLWVSYTDIPTVRRRLVGVAQQVLGLLERSEITPLPELVIPPQRERHGFWFMKFPADQEATLAEAQEELNGQPFRSHCGSIQGVVHVDAGTQPMHLRAMLMLEREGLDAVGDWLRAAFGRHGQIESVTIPRLKCNWDGGMAYVRFAHAEDAQRALEELDGTPSCVPGCNMYVDYARPKPLVEMKFART